MLSIFDYNVDTVTQGKVQERERGGGGGGKKKDLKKIKKNKIKFFKLQN